MDIEIKLKDSSSNRQEEYMVGGLRGFLRAAEMWIDRRGEGCRLDEFYAKFIDDDGNNSDCHNKSCLSENMREMEAKMNQYDAMREALESLVTGVETLIADLECDWEGHMPEDYRELFNCIDGKIKAAHNALSLTQKD